MTANTLSKDGGTGCTEDTQIATGRAAKRLASVKIRTLMTSGRCIRKKSASIRHKREDLSKFSPVARRVLKYHAQKKVLADFLQKQREAEEAHYGRLRDQGVPYTPFEEKQFGDLIPHDRASRDFPCSVVSIALFDGDTMLFACSGILVPDGRSKLELTRYVTSACLVRQYEEKRYRGDKLRIEVRLPNGKKKGGFLYLCNRLIAIVALLDHQAGHPMDVEIQAGLPSDGEEMVVAGRSFESGNLMATKVKLGGYGKSYPYKVCPDTPNCGRDLSFWKPVSSKGGGPVAVLGGPVLGEDKRIIGINIDVDSTGAYVSFLPLEPLCAYLKHFRIFNPGEHFRRYSLPDDVYTIFPTGFMSKIYRLKHRGYPTPPPLVLEFNGQLVNTFEDFFGDVRAWKGYPFGAPSYCERPVWVHLRKSVVKHISRRVVSVASYDGYERHFACTGLLIKWHQRTVVLTSASLVRSCSDEDIYEDEIDNNLTIEVLLPPKQRASGKLELYSLKYNIAIISFKKKFISTCPEDITRKYSTPKLSGKVVAVGSEPLDGLLMASIGEVIRTDRDFKLDCKDLRLSTCKIWKAGIGGPLINLDGSCVGMNFFDQRTLTPFLPRSKIVKVLRSEINLPLPSERGVNAPVRLKYDLRANSYRWPVPEPYWYHGLLDVAENFHEHIGRFMQQPPLLLLWET